MREYCIVFDETAGCGTYTREAQVATRYDLNDENEFADFLAVFRTAYRRRHGENFEIEIRDWRELSADDSEACGERYELL